MLLVRSGSSFRGGPPPWSGGRGRRGGRGGGWRGGWGGRGWWGGPGTVPTPEPLPPPPPNVFRVATTTVDGRGLESPVSPRFARGPYIVVVDVANGSVVNVKVMANPFANFPHGAGVAFAQWLIFSGVRAVLAPNLGPNAAMVLQQAGVAIYSAVPGARVIDALRSLGIVRA